jgi:hypothetical protein
MHITECIGQACAVFDAVATNQDAMQVTPGSEAYAVAYELRLLWGR